MGKEEKLKWYVVNTYSGFEHKAKKSLQQRIIQESLEDHFGDLEEGILIPVEKVVENAKGGAKKTSERKFYPGYMLIHMILTEIGRASCRERV